MNIFPYPAQALLDPLDADTIISLFRMSIISPDGSLDYDGLAALVTVLGSELYDMLESEGYDTDHMTLLLRGMKDCETQFLFLCIMYSEFGVGTPEQLILLVAHRPALTEFMHMLINEFEDISDKTERLEQDDMLLAAVRADIDRYYIEREKEERRIRRRTKMER